MMRFGVLGPVVLRDDEGFAPVAPPMVRHVLAVLLCRIGQPVAVTDLMDELWPGGAPTTAQKTLQGYVHRLRLVLGVQAGIRFANDAYTLQANRQEVDAGTFADLGGRGTAALSAGRPDDAVTQFRAAIDLWRGAAYGDVPAGRIVANEVRRLEDQRLLVRERWTAADLARGRHAEVAAELPDLIEEHPYHEGLRAHLMVALYRSGRQAEALDVYRRARELLAEELGIEPGPDLQQLHLAILAGDEGLLWTVTAPEPTESRGAPDRPRELPPDVSGFVGRGLELDELSRMLAPDSGAGLVVLGGTAGVGKTALAVRWAHRAVSHFPDGQLFIDLRGFSSAPPLRPVEALALLLRSLGVSSDRIPLAETEAAALYRSRMAGRRMLVLLDNAASAEQVRPLLPASPGCFVLLTSRNRLAGLVARDGARYVPLDQLGTHDAVALLTRLLGDDRTADGPDAVVELAEVCGFLPLALRIAAAQLIYHPQRTVVAHVRALRADRIGNLSVPDDERSAVRTVFDHSYRALLEPDRRVFGLLGLIPGDDFEAGAVVALTRTDAGAAARSLDRLCAAHLVSQHEERYQVHDLLREYAAGLVRPAEAEPASIRLFEWYLDRVHAAASAAYPTVVRLSYPDTTWTFADRSAALAWLRTEQANLVAAVSVAAVGGHHRLAWGLADALRGYLYLVRASHELLAVAQAALPGARASGDLRAEAAIRVAGGQALMMMDQPGLAAADIRAGVELSERAGWTHGLALALTMQCRLDLRTDRLEQLVVHSERALAAYEAADQPGGQAIALGWLGLGHLLTGSLPASLAVQRRAMALHHVSHGRFDRAATLTNLGETLHLLGRSDEALEHLDEALAIFGEMGQPVDEAATHTCLAIVYRDTGRTTEAAAEAARARELCAQIDDLSHRIGAEHVWATIAAARADGPARQLFAEALRLAGQFTMRHPEAEIRTSLARALRAEGRCEEAVAEACRALALAEAGAYRVVAARANAILAEALADLGQPAQAEQHAARAATLRAETGLRL